MPGWLPYLTPAQRGTIGCNSLPFVCPFVRPSCTCRSPCVRVSLNPRPCNTSITPEAYTCSCIAFVCICVYVSVTAFQRGEKSNDGDDGEEIPAAHINEECRGPWSFSKASGKRENQKKPILIFQITSHFYSWSLFLLFLCAINWNLQWYAIDPENMSNFKKIMQKGDAWSFIYKIRKMRCRYNVSMRELCSGLDTRPMMKH